MELDVKRVNAFKEYYNQVQSRNEGVRSNGWYEASGIMLTLNILGIEIEGVNCKIS